MTSNLCINRLILALTLCGGLPFTSKAELNYSDKAIVQQSTIKVKGIVVDEQGESIIGATVILSLIWMGNLCLMCLRVAIW